MNNLKDFKIGMWLSDAPLPYNPHYFFTFSQVLSKDDVSITFMQYKTYSKNGPKQPWKYSVFKYVFDASRLKDRTGISIAGVVSQSQANQILIRQVFERYNCAGIYYGETISDWDR